jgi:hypothetical protein
MAHKLALLELESFVPVPLFPSHPLFSCSFLFLPFRITMYYSSAAANLIVKTFLGSGIMVFD